MKKSNSSPILLSNARLFINNKLEKGSIFIKKGIITKVILGDEVDEKDDILTLDCENAIISYGFCDPHVHFRYPGNPHKEDWRTGSLAAIRGGYTFVIDMPNTKPTTVDLETLRLKNERAKQNAIINYGFHLGLTDENASELNKILEECEKESIPVYGIKAFLGASTGDLLVKEDDSVLAAFATNKIVLFHAENDNDIIANAPFVSLDQHALNRPAIAEANAIRRIHQLCKLSKNPRPYICHVSSKLGIEAIKAIRKEYPIKAEVTPHHATLSLDMNNSTAIAKVNPPIRAEHDLHAVQTACSEKFFDAIGTDHAPHLYSEKISDNPPSGFPGLETAFYAMTTLIEKNILSLETILHYLTASYSIFGIAQRGEIKEGNHADLTFIHEESYSFNAHQAASKAKFSPFNGFTSKYHIPLVMLSGRLINTTTFYEEFII